MNMPRFAANLTMMYGDVDFRDRFTSAATDHFSAVEYLFPYEYPAEQLAGLLQANDLVQVLFNAPPGNWDAGERGLACLPGREAEFREGIRTALAYAAALDCPRIHVMAGIVSANAKGNALRDTYLANLTWASNEASKDGRDILIEPINTRDMPGYYLNRQDVAHAILAEVGAENLSVQMDLYHLQIGEGDVATKLRQYLPTGNVGHLQIAGVPDRHEPDSGEVNYDYLFDVIDEASAESGWDGWIGCEYRPRLGAQPGGTTAGLDWLRRRNQ
jgi:2-dehydrotetronate isomerase